MTAPAALSTLVDRRRERLLVGGCCIAAVVAGAATAAGGGPAVAVALAGAALFVLVVTRPVAAAYLFIAALPFIAGIERGLVVPQMRPHEALQAFVTVAVLAGVYVRVLRGDTLSVRATRLDRAILALATLGSLWPLLWLLVRGQDPTSTDVFSTVTLWRLAALYALFRYVVRTPQQVRRCLWILLAGASALAVFAVLQSIGLPTISVSAEAGGGRGNATLSSSIAVGDYLAYSLAVVLGLYLRGATSGRLLAGVGTVLVIGVLGTGQFSAWIAAPIVLLAIAAHERQLARLATRALPALAVGLVVAWPVVGRRLSGFGGDLGYPSSWHGRIDNLTNFYLPELGGFRWILGVRPDPVLPAPETWRDVIYLESGVLWLLWVGGIPMLLAFGWFLYTAFRHTHRVAVSRSDDIGVVSLAAFGSLCAMSVLMTIDMHLTLRGGGDLLFILLGLSANRLVPPSPGPDEIPRSSSTQEQMRSP